MHPSTFSLQKMLYNLPLHFYERSGSPEYLVNATYFVFHSVIHVRGIGYAFNTTLMEVKVFLPTCERTMQAAYQRGHR